MKEKIGYLLAIVVHLFIGLPIMVVRGIVLGLAYGIYVEMKSWYNIYKTL